MSDPATVLELVEIPISEIARPTHSLILADRGFMSTLANAEKEGAGLAIIKDAVGAQAAASLQSRVTKAQSLLKKQRLDLIRPYQNLIDQINAAAKEPDARLATLKESLGRAQTAFALEQRRLAEEQERQRQAELKRLEDQRIAEEKAAKEKADKIAADLKAKQDAEAKIAEAARAAGLPIQPVMAVESWDDELPAAPVVIQKTPTELEIERLKFAPAPVVAKPSGVRIITTLVPFVENPALLPDIFVDRIPKIAAIRSTFCAGFKPGDPIPVLAGCRFEVQTSTQSTGKAGF